MVAPPPPPLSRAGRSSKGSFSKKSMEGEEGHRRRCIPSSLSRALSSLFIFLVLHSSAKSKTYSLSFQGKGATKRCEATAKKRGGESKKEEFFFSLSLSFGGSARPTSSNLARLAFFSLFLLYRFFLSFPPKTALSLCRRAVSSRIANSIRSQISKTKKTGEEMDEGAVVRVTADASAAAGAASAAAATTGAAAARSNNAAATDDGSKPLARRAAARRVTSFKEPTASDGEFLSFCFFHLSF